MGLACQSFQIFLQLLKISCEWCSSIFPTPEILLQLGALDSGLLLWCESNSAPSASSALIFLTRIVDPVLINPHNFLYSGHIICKKICHLVCKPKVCARKVCKRVHCGNKKVCHAIVKYRLVKYKVKLPYTPYSYYGPKWIIKIKKVPYTILKCHLVAQYCTKCHTVTYVCGKSCHKVCRKGKVREIFLYILTLPLCHCITCMCCRSPCMHAWTCGCVGNFVANEGQNAAMESPGHTFDFYRGGKKCSRNCSRMGIKTVQQRTDNFPIGLVLF